MRLLKTEMFAGQLIVGGVLSVTVNIVVAVAVLPSASVAVTVIVCGPIPTSVPAAGLCDRVTPGQLSDALLPVKTFGIATWQFASAEAAVAEGAVTLGGVVSGEHPAPGIANT